MRTLVEIIAVAVVVVVVAVQTMLRAERVCWLEVEGVEVWSGMWMWLRLGRVWYGHVEMMCVLVLVLTLALVLMLSLPLPPHAPFSHGPCVGLHTEPAIHQVA